MEQNGRNSSRDQLDGFSLDWIPEHVEREDFPPSKKDSRGPPKRASASLDGPPLPVV